MLKTLIISEEGRGGGPLKRIERVASITKNHLNTTVLCPKDSLFQKVLEEKKIETVGICLSTIRKDFIHVLRYVFLFPYEIYNITKHIKSHNPDIVHVASASQIKGLLAAKITKKKVLWQMNDSYQPRIIEKMFTLFSALPDAYVFVSNKSMTYYSNICPDILYKKHWVLQSPVDTFIAPIQKNIIDTQRLRLVLIGYINAHKGIELLIQGLTLLNNPNISVDIAGPVLDTQKSYFRSLINLKLENKIQGLNFIGYQDITPNFLSNYDYCISTSIREASPTALWESMAVGLPIICTNVGDVQYFIDKYHCGIKIESFDAGAVAKAINTAITLKSSQYEQLSHNAYKAAKENFDVMNIAQQYMHCYYDLLNE